jgi:hypothetical protein
LHALGATAAFALDERYCRSYSDRAVEQTREYHFHKCTEPGDLEWWSTDETYHFNWCRRLPDGSGLAEMSGDGRASMLSACTDAKQRQSVATGHPTALPCPQTIGMLVFSAERDVEPMLAAPDAGTDAARMTCTYHYANGVITLYATWAVPAEHLEWPVTAPLVEGCTKSRGLKGSYRSSSGLGHRSARFVADAGITGSTPETARLAMDNGFGAVQTFLTGAEHQARSCAASAKD